MRSVCATLFVPVTLIALLTSLVGSAQASGDARATNPIRVIPVGPQHQVKRIADAARIARDGDIVEIEHGVYPRDVARWSQSNLTIRAVGGNARIVADGASAEEKAIWVIAGNNVTIENIEFAGAAVADENGAGVRHEGGRLTVRNCLFEGNEMGLLTANNPAAELIVEESEFRDNAVARARRPHGPIGHQIYVGAIHRFALTASYVHRGTTGHLVKSRARENVFFYNRISDEEGGRASYEIEFPNGGRALLVGNIVQQGTLTENAALIAFGAEGYRGPRNELVLINNTLVDGLPGGGSFLRTWPGPVQVKAANNLLLGAGAWPRSLGRTRSGNFRGGPLDVASVKDHDYRLRVHSAMIGAAVDPGSLDDVILRPTREYVHPRQTRPVAPTAYNPGAMQTHAP